MKYKIAALISIAVLTFVGFSKYYTLKWYLCGIEDADLQLAFFSEYISVDDVERVFMLSDDSVKNLQALRLMTTDEFKVRKFGKLVSKIESLYPRDQSKLSAFDDEAFYAFNGIINSNIGLGDQMRSLSPLYFEMQTDRSLLYAAILDSNRSAAVFAETIRRYLRHDSEIIKDKGLTILLNKPIIGADRYVDDIRALKGVTSPSLAKKVRLLEAKLNLDTTAE